MRKYLLDTNVFIEANKMTYPPDLFPGFWEWLEKELVTGNLYSIIPIYEEILKGKDELVNWAKEQYRKNVFHSVDDEITQQHYIKIVKWAVSPEQNFKSSAQRTFLDVADSWLIAKALSNKATVVTHEQYSPGSKKRILIPNVCKAFNIPYLNTIELMRNRGALFN